MNRNIPKSYMDRFVLESLLNTSNAGICLCEFTMDSYNYVKATILHQQEKKDYENWEFEKRIKSFLIGRYAAKKAIASLTGEERLEEIMIQNGIFGQPIVKHAANQNIQVSITHCNNYGAALAFFEDYPMGIDMDLINENNCKLIESCITDKEKRLIEQVPYDYSSALTLLWTARESLSKVLRTGLTTPMHIFAVKNIETSCDGIINNYENFAQYTTLSFKLNEYMISITYPKNIQLNFDVSSFKENFIRLTRDDTSLLMT